MRKKLNKYAFKERNSVQISETNNLNTNNNYSYENDILNQ